MDVRIQRFLTERLHISNKEALHLLIDKNVIVNQQIAIPNQIVTDVDTIYVNNQLLHQGQAHCYAAMYKPRGIECTLNPDIVDNLATLLTNHPHLYPVGRLDKESEGLLLLTNDGTFYNQITHADHFCEKEYRVSVNHPLNDSVIQQLSAGIEIMGKQTRPCTVIKESDYTFRIILTQGINRQIRRMCYKLGYQVSQLIRIRIGKFDLHRMNDVQEGCLYFIDKNEIENN